ncbi:MAG: hypothetical protein ACR2KH_00785 [Sphingomicrobium sp.]
MSRFEGDFAGAGGGPLSNSELLDLLAAFSALHGRERQEAIACYLSSSEGWDEAMKALRGAFAADAAQAVRSSAESDDKHDINQRASEYLQWQALKAAGNDND